MRSLILAAAAAVVLACGACTPAASSGAPASSSPRPSPSHAASVRAATVHGLGRVLVTHSGRTLYMFPPDRGGHVTCTGACAGTWPPLRLDAGQVPKAGPGVRDDLLGSVVGPSGEQVVTYHDWPLYTYVGDVESGQANGQALDLNGAPWYVVRPSGKPVFHPRGPT